MLANFCGLAIQVVAMFLDLLGQNKISSCVYNFCRCDDRKVFKNATKYTVIFKFSETKTKATK